jgi:hypothetical protein
MEPTMYTWKSFHQSAPADGARSQFSGIRIGNCPRRKRVTSFATALAEQPGKMIPELFTRKYDIAVRWVRVADREADIYEYMACCRRAGHGFVIRVSQNRVLLNPADGKRLGLIFHHVVGVAPVGGMYLDLRGRDGQVARRAKLLISCGQV